VFVIIWNAVQVRQAEDDNESESIYPITQNQKAIEDKILQ
jgi:hypothetical protein